MFAPILQTNGDHCTKTGSGQTKKIGKAALEKRAAFSFLFFSYRGVDGMV
jgi:hypothetical protein